MFKAKYHSQHASKTVPTGVPGFPKSQAKVALRSQGGQVSWVDSLVLEHDSAGHRYLVQLQAVSTTASPMPAATAPTFSNKPLAASCSIPTAPFWVPRVHVCFAAEDPVQYAKRFASACAAVAAAEVQLAHELCIDSMPIDDVPQLSTEQVNRVLLFALNSKKLKDKLMDTSSLINEANLEHARAMNKAALQSLAAAAVADSDAASGGSAAQGYAASASGAVVGVQLMPLVAPPSHAVKPVPSKGTVQMPAGYDFRELLSEFCFKTLLTKPEVTHALAKIRLESSKV